MNKNKKTASTLIFISVCLMLFVYLGIFIYLNMFKYTEHVDSDIAVEALLAREIWTEKTLTPDNWISSTERRLIATPALAALFYGISGNMVFSMGLSCSIISVLFLGSIAFTLKRCQVSGLGTATALLALCALPINGLRNDGQMVPFVTLLWFLFAQYYVMHCIFLFLCIAFYLHLRKCNLGSNRTSKIKCALAWCFLLVFCGGLSLGGMRCLQVITLPLAIWEILLLFSESRHLSKRLPRQRFLATAFLGTLLLISGAAMLYPTSVSYPMYLQDANGMITRLFHDVPVAILECLGIAGNCTLFSLASLMQIGILAIGFLTIYGLILLLGPKSDLEEYTIPQDHKLLLTALCSTFVFTIFVEIVTTAETAHNYFFMIWFIIIAVLAVLITYYEEKSPVIARFLAILICCFAICNISYTYRDCITSEDNLSEYQEVISYMESQNITTGYGEFWDASRISMMTNGAITMGHCYRMEDLQMYWWLTSTKWYTPNLPETMPTAYVVCREDKESFLTQFEDPCVVTLGFENDRFAVYTSDLNLVPMIK